MDISTSYFHQNALITGGMGFIGSNLARRLLDFGANVTIIDNLDHDSGGNLFNLSDIKDRLQIIHADISDDHQLAMAVKGQRYLFNLAGQMSHLGSMQDPFKDLNVNTIAQLKLLEVCRINNPEIGIVFAGTRQVYGRANYLPVDENHLLTPLDNNGVSKRAGEMYHIVYNRVYGMSTSVLRMTNIYGPRMRIKDDLLTFIGWWFHRLLMGDNIRIFGDGSQIRDFNYVDDVVNALLLCAANPVASGKIYNLGGPPINLLNLAQLMIEINGSGNYQMVPFPEKRKRIDIGNYYGDYGLIQRELGWQPQTSLHDGIVKTLDFYHINKEHYL
ncbi:MAG: GDP-mannose 4,6-dehydratase [Anaerolineales bacterium]|nr:GDP-mannose 4,6-dehydratase [Anaerolineales bacterium]